MTDRATEITRLVCDVHGITLGDMQARCRLSRYVDARRDAIRTMAQSSISARRIAQVLRRDWSTIRQHLRAMGAQ